MKPILFQLLFIFFVLRLFSQTNTTQNEVMEGTPNDIIIIVNHSMSSSYLTNALLKNKDSLCLSKMPVSGYIKSWLPTYIKPDALQKASAIAAGNIVQPGNISEDAWGKPLKTLFEYAKEWDMTTGIITNSSLTHSPMLSFITHQPRMKNDEDMAAIISKNPPDCIIGGGYKYFFKREDKTNLIQSFLDKHYIFESNYKKLAELMGNRIIALLADDDIPSEYMHKDFLYKATETAITLGLTNRKGYLFVIEDSKNEQIYSSGKHENLAIDAIEFDKFVARIKAKAGNQTLILVIGDDEGGKLNIIGANLKKGTVEAEWLKDINEPGLIPFFASGPSAYKFNGILYRTDIYNRLVEIMKSR